MPRLGQGFPTSGLTWRIRIVPVKANWFDPVLVPVSRRAAALESSPLAGEIVRLTGHGRASPRITHSRLSNPRRLPARSLGSLARTGFPPNLPFPVLESSPLAGEIVRLTGHGRTGLPTDLVSWPANLKTLTRQAGRILRRRARRRFLASEPENSHPASGEDRAEVGSRKSEVGSRRSRPASGEDLSFSNGTEIGMREGRKSGENPTD
jgi:hypothetical protein